MPRALQPRAGWMTTRCPMPRAVTSRPTSVMSPTSSCPMTKGMEVTGARYGLPFAQIVARSEPQMPASRGAMRTHCGVGSFGSGISTSDSGAIPAV